ncbi:MAG: tetratricopeptide repeat protein [Acidobacteriota bacterium]|nr:tetratricopeptide repeat protein [Acidobacteriota bacterium]
MISFYRFRLAVTCLALTGAAFSTQVMGATQQGTDIASPGLRASVTDAPSPPRAAVTPLTSETRGDIYMARKMYREAIDVYRQAPQTAVTLNKIGIAFHEMLQFDLAKKNYERAVKLDPRYSEAINNLGTVFYAQKFYKKAITYYKRSLKFSNSSASVYANMGAAYFARKDFKHSSQYYEEALRLDPDVLERRYGFGTLMQERTVTDLALFHLYLAKAYAKSGSNQRALLYLRKALEEGLKDRKKLPDVPEFNLLKDDPNFQQLLAENPKPL